MSRCPHPSLESTWAPNLYVFNQIWKKTAQALKYINKLFWKWYPHTTAMFRFLRMVPKAMRRLLLQQCRLLPQIALSLVEWETTVLFTQRSCKQFCLLLNKHINLKKENSWFSETHNPPLQALGKLKTLKTYYIIYICSTKNAETKLVQGK